MVALARRFAELAVFLKAFILLGGNMTTITATYVELLKRAMAEPTTYRTLRVRVGGWSAHFVALSPFRRAQPRAVAAAHRQGRAPPLTR